MTPVAAVCVEWLKKGESLLTLEATDGSLKVADSLDIFPGGIDRDFSESFFAVPSTPMRKENVRPYQLTGKGDFREIFGSVGHTYKFLSFTQSQVVRFATDFKKLLDSERKSTFILFHHGKDMVADLTYFGRDLSILVFDFWTDKQIWRPDQGRQVILPEREITLPGPF